MITPFKTIQPQFQVTHDIGYIGFTYFHESLISLGIAHFTKWARMSEITVTMPS